MSRTLFLVGIGSLLGGMARYLSATYISKFFPPPFPYGTFTVNILGCLIIGIVYQLSERFSFLTPDLRIFLTTGFCGGFTTFSTFSYESIKLIQDGEFLYLSLNVVVSIILGFGATYLGITITKFL